MRLHLATDQRSFTIIYNDFRRSKLLKPNEKIVFETLKMYADNETGKAFPSYETLAEDTGLSSRSVMRCIKRMEKLGVLRVERRKDEERGNTSNMYTLYDTAEMWASSSPEEVASAIDKAEEERMLQILRAKGYTITKEKEPVSDTDQSEETDPQNIEPEVSSGTISRIYDTTHTRDNQDKKVLSDAKKHQTIIYPESFVRRNLLIDWLIEQYPEDKKYYEAMSSIIYDTLNSTTPTIRAEGQDKQAEIVKSQILKLSYEDLITVLEKFKQNTNRISFTDAWMLTALYKQSKTSSLDTHNLYQHNTYGDIQEE